MYHYEGQPDGSPEDMDDYEPTQCPDCSGKGYNDEWKAISGHHYGGEVLRITCDACEGEGVTAGVNHDAN